MQNSPDLLTSALQNPTLREAELGRRRARDGTDGDVLAWIEATFGVRIPAVACCPGHVAPAQAFCDALRARDQVALWIASRAFGGKTFLLALLAAANAILFETDVIILGGSGQQSLRVVEHLHRLWAAGQVPPAWLASAPSVHQDHLRLGQHDPGPEGLTDRRARGPPHAPVARRDRRDGAPDSGSRPGPAHGPQRRAGTDRDELHPSVSRWHGHGHAAPGGRAGLARLRVVLSGNAQTPRVADRGPGRAEASRTVPHDVGRRVRTPGTQCRRTRHRPARRGADVRRRPWHTHPRGRSRTPLARPAGTPAERAWPDPAGAWYCTGIDWAQKRDYTVAVVVRCDTTPLQLVAVYRAQRRSWQVMTEHVGALLDEYPGPAAHDATGGGNAMGEFPALAPHDQLQGVTLVGRVRTDLFRNYIGAIERHEIVCPRIDAFYTEHLYCGEDDLFGSGHPPDTVVAMALAYHAFKAGRQPGDYGVTI